MPNFSYRLVDRSRPVKYVQRFPRRRETLEARARARRQSPRWDSENISRLARAPRGVTRDDFADAIERYGPVITDPPSVEDRRVSRRPITGRASSRAPRAMADSAGPRRENESSRGRREDPSESDSSMSSCDLSMSASDAFEVRADRVDAAANDKALGLDLFVPSDDSDWEDSDDDAPGEDSDPARRRQARFARVTRLQERAARRLTRHLKGADGERKTWKRATLVLPCGAGKTVLAMMAIAALKTRTLVLTSGREACTQWRRELLAKTTLGEDDVAVYASGSHRGAPSSRRC